LFEKRNEGRKKGEKSVLFLYINRFIRGKRSCLSDLQPIKVDCSRSINSKICKKIIGNNSSIIKIDAISILFICGKKKV
jgi:hypothetical protein